MRTVVAVVHPSDSALVAVDRAIADVRAAGGRLVLLAVHDPATERDLNTRLSTEGFVGSALCENVARIACKNLREQNAALLDEATKRARAAEIEPETIAKDGVAFREAIPRVAVELDPARVFMTRVPERLWSRLLRGSANQAVVRDTPCPVVVVD